MDEPFIPTPDEDMARAWESYLKRHPEVAALSAKERMWIADAFAYGWKQGLDKKQAGE